jgi:hypothetical protein
VKKKKEKENKTYENLSHSRSLEPHRIPLSLLVLPLPLGEHIMGSPFTVKIVEDVIPRPEELVFRRKWEWKWSIFQST